MLPIVPFIPQKLLQESRRSLIHAYSHLFSTESFLPENERFFPNGQASEGFLSRGVKTAVERLDSPQTTIIHRVTRVKDETWKAWRGKECFRHRLPHALNYLYCLVKRYYVSAEMAFGRKGTAPDSFSFGWEMSLVRLPWNHPKENKHLTLFMQIIQIIECMLHNIVSFFTIICPKLPC